MPYDTTTELTDFDFSAAPTSGAVASLSSTSTVAERYSPQAETAPAIGGPIEMLTPMSQARSAFYASLPASEASVLQSASSRIGASLSLIGKNMLMIGAELIMVSDKLPGHFEEWLKLEFSFSRATAYNYINAATHFANSPRVIEALPAMTVYKLASKTTPVDVRAAVIREIAAGEVVSARDVEDRIAAAKTQAADEKRAKAKEDERERERLAREEGWRAKALELTDAGLDATSIERERKKWDSVPARRERARQLKVAEEQRRKADYLASEANAKESALKAIELLEKHLPPEAITALRTCSLSHSSWSALRTALREAAGATT